MTLTTPARSKKKQTLISSDSSNPPSLEEIPAPSVSKKRKNPSSSSTVKRVRSNTDPGTVENAAVTVDALELLQAQVSSLNLGKIEGSVGRMETAMTRMQRQMGELQMSNPRDQVLSICSTEQHYFSNFQESDKQIIVLNRALKDSRETSNCLTSIVATNNRMFEQTTARLVASERNCTEARARYEQLQGYVHSFLFSDRGRASCELLRDRSQRLAAEVTSSYN